MKTAIVHYLDLPRGFIVGVSRESWRIYDISITVSGNNTFQIYGVKIIQNSTPIKGDTRCEFYGRSASMIQLVRYVYDVIYGVMRRATHSVYVKEDYLVKYAHDGKREYNIDQGFRYFGNCASINSVYLEWYDAEIENIRAVVSNTMVYLPIPIRNEILQELPFQSVIPQTFWDE